MTGAAGLAGSQRPPRRLLPFPGHYQPVKQSIPHLADVLTGW